MIARVVSCERLVAGAVALTVCPRNIITGEHDRVGRLDSRSQRRRILEDVGINRVSDGGQWICGLVCPLGYAPEIPMTNHSRRATL